jgi:hypothetical protein
VATGGALSSAPTHREGVADGVLSDGEAGFIKFCSQPGARLQISGGEDDASYRGRIGFRNASQCFDFGDETILIDRGVHGCVPVKGWRFQSL